MKYPLLAAVSKVQICLYLCMFSAVAAAQGTGAVVESRPYTPGQATRPSGVSAAANPTSSNNDALSLLLEQNQQLQAEVSALRGLVEEQGFELRKLQRDSLSRYTNMDERLSALEAGGSASAVARSPFNTAEPPTTTGLPATATTPGSVTNPISSITPSASPGITSANASGPAQATGIAGTTTPIASAPASDVSDTSSSSTSRISGRGTLQPAVLSEQQLYQMAYDSVINSNFERSVAEFDQYLSIYPQGRFVTNAHYWKGQAYLYLNRFEESREAYEIIIDQYADSPKLMDAMYGLALAYQGLGNIPQARRLLTDIKRRFPNTGVANLADTRLLSLD